MGDFGEQLRGILDQTVGISARRREAEEVLQRELAQMRRDAERKLKEKWRDERMTGVRLIERAVREYASVVSGALRRKLAGDERMPLVINHLERYAAFKGMQDRRELLARIEQTIDLAAQAAQRACSVDPSAALDEAAEAYRVALEELSGVKVGAPKEQAGGGALGEEDVPGDSSADRKETLDALVGGANDVFSDAALRDVHCSGGGAGEANAAERATLGTSGEQTPEERKELFAEVLRAASALAEEPHRARLHQNAISVAGSAAAMGDLPVYSGQVSCSLVFDPDQVRELASLVKESFATYQRVVQDNGVFAAFSEGSSFGRCVGYTSWMSGWDDWSAEEYGYDDSEYLGEIPGREFVRSRIPSSVEDADDEGDALPTVVERMHAFNKRRYFGMLDDDFKQHVDAFWYGFGKLMEFANGLVEVDMSVYRAYCDDVAAEAAHRCGDLALLMDDAQLEAYCSDIRAMRDAARKRDDRC